MDYKTAKGADSDMYSYAHGISLFNHLSSHPIAAESLHNFMAAVKSGKRLWMDVFLAESLEPLRWMIRCSLVSTVEKAMN
jgi:hypothetical protein